MQVFRALAVVSVAFIVARTVPAQAQSLPPEKPIASSVPGHSLLTRWASPTLPRRTSSGAGVARAAVAEVERNDTLGFADSFGGQVDYDGNISPTGDVDVVVYDLPFDAVVTFDMSAIGAFPNQDATLAVRDGVGQMVGYNDDRVGSLWPLIVLHLPAGTYYCEAAGVAHSTAGTYRLTLSAVPTAFAPVTVNGTTTATVPAGGEAPLWLTLASDAHVNLTVSNNGGQNLYLFVRRRTGGVLRLVLDGSGGTDPGFDGHLPAGRYLLLLGDTNGVGGPVAFTTTVTPGAVPPISCGGSVIGTGAGTESLALYSLTLAAASRIDFDVTGSGATPMSDPYLWIYDRNMNVIVHADNTGASPLPRVITPLPAGQYFIGVEPDTNAAAGTFQLAVGCTPFAPPVVRFASVNTSIANTSESVAHVFPAGTPIPFELRAINTTFQIPVLTVIDAAGDVLAFSDYAVDLIGNRSRNADLWVLVREFRGGTGSFTIDIRAQNYFAGPFKGLLQMYDKAGSIHYPFASAATLPFQYAVPAPFTGNLLINVPLVSLPAVTIPVGGWRTYPAFFPNGAYFIQSISLTSVPLGGSMANIAR